MDVPLSHYFTTLKSPCRYMVGTWALKGLLYHDFGAYVYTIVVLGPFGNSLLVCALPTKPLCTEDMQRVAVDTYQNTAATNPELGTWQIAP